MDWAAFGGAILGAIFGSVITAIASFKIANKTIKADLKRTETEIKARFNIEIEARIKRDMIDQFKINLAELVTISYDVLITCIGKKDFEDRIQSSDQLLNNFTMKKSYIELMMIDESPLNIEINTKIGQLEKCIADYFSIINVPFLFTHLLDDKNKKRFEDVQEEINLLNKNIIFIGKKILKKEYENIDNFITQSP